MTLEQTISKELNKAIKAGDKLRMNTLRSIRASIIEFNKSGIGRTMNPEDEMNLLNSASKKRKESIDMFEKGGRIDLVEQEKAELAILQEFLPKQLTTEEVEKIIKSIVNESGAESMKDIGKVMGPAMKELKGKADGAVVQQLVRKLLGSE